MNMHTTDIGSNASKGQASVNMRDSAKAYTPAPTLTSLARAALADNENNVESASESLALQLEQPEIRRALAQDAVSSLAQSAIASVRAYERMAVERGLGASKVLSRAAAVDRSFMAWPLPFGGVLGDATAAEIRRAIEHYDSASASMQRRAGFLRRVVAALPEGAVVRNALTEAQLAEWGSTQ